VEENIKFVKFESIVTKDCRVNLSSLTLSLTVSSRRSRFEEEGDIYNDERERCYEFG
jgi:hypothetical protein